ncbi:MAG: hypothetical protein EHJ94_07630, partial [Deltaproteobacteria bacterium]
GAVAVAMYDDHLEITNPGELQFGLTPEKLTKSGLSRDQVEIMHFLSESG